MGCITAFKFNCDDCMEIIIIAVYYINMIMLGNIIYNYDRTGWNRESQHFVNKLHQCGNTFLPHRHDNISCNHKQFPVLFIHRKVTRPYVTVHFNIFTLI